MQPGDGSAQHDETRTCDPSAGVEVDALRESRADVDVVARLECELTRRPPTTQLDVRALVATVGNGRLQEVRQIEHAAIQCRLHGLEPGIGLFELSTERLTLAQQRSCVL